MRVLLLAAMLPLVGCVQTSELPMAANVVRLESSAGGIVGRARAPKETLRRAAEMTLAKGYTHFVLADVNSSTDTFYAGSSPGQVSVHGNTATVRPGSPRYGSRTSVGVTVVMYRASDPQAASALNAREVLAANG